MSRKTPYDINKRLPINDTNILGMWEILHVTFPIFWWFIGARGFHFNNPMAHSPNPNLPVRAAESRVGRENQRYNPENGARMVAGCICLEQSKQKVIMISSSAHKGQWVFPKGGIELDEGDDFVVSAVRETWEEAGCEGRIVKKLPVVYDIRGSKAPVLKPGEDFDPHKVIPKSEFHFYEMSVESLSKEWPEAHKRERRWCTYSEAKHELLKGKRAELVSALDASSIIKDSAEF
ncbi:hypothetical protein CJJ07_003067 [Candidozyma auris]|nr:hypothetical protein CJJ07_003067 [[Candida] auris]